MARPRMPYTEDEDLLLMKYIAVYNPPKAGRMGNVLYQRLVANAEGKWKWSERHSWQSWRERYKDNEKRFDALIRRYQRKKGIQVDANVEGSSQVNQMQRSTANGQNVSTNTVASNSSPRVSPKKEPGPSYPLSSGDQENANEESLPGGSGNRRPSPKMCKGIARKTARKTAVVFSSEPEDEEVDQLASDQEGLVEAEENARGKKRKAHEIDVIGEPKRQRINEHSPDEGRVDRNASSRTGPLVPSTPSANRIPSSQPPVSQAPASTAMEILSSFGDNVLNNKLTISRLMNVLGSKPEVQREVMEFAKAKLNQAGPSSIDPDNAQERGNLYPRLGKEDLRKGDFGNQDEFMPGSWDDTQGPVASTPANPPKQSNGVVSPIGDPTIEAEGSGHRHDNHGGSTDKRPAFTPRPRASKKTIGEDFFKTPSPSPQKTNALHSNQLTPKAQVTHEQPQNSPENRPSLPKRDPPQFPKGGFSNSFVPFSQRQVSFQRRGRDVDSESDTDVIPDEEHPRKVMNKVATPKASWPPTRKVNRTENKISPVGISKPIQKTTAAASQKRPSQSIPTAKPTQTASKEVPKVALKPNGSKDLGVASLTSVNKPQPEASTLKVRNSRVLHRANQNKPRPQKASVETRIIPEAGPSQANSPPLPRASVEDIDKAESIHAWRTEAQLTESRSASVSLTTESDPFLTKDHAIRLRQLEKGKGKEKTKVVVSTRENARSEMEAEARARANRRKTFAGFPTQRPPEIDLRKRALQSSFAGNAQRLNRRLSFSSAFSLPRDAEDNGNQPQDRDQEPDQEESRINRRTSVTATIDLSQEFPSPHSEIPPTDHAYIMRAGIQVLIQSIAQNHLVTEDFVRGIYEELGDLRATDRVISKMRQIAEKAVEEELEKEKRKRRESDLSVGTISVSQIPGSSSRQSNQRVQTTPERREAENVSPGRHRSISGSARRRSELQITPADEDPTFTRLRNQYIPPSSSRAARIMRHRVRRSSGLASSPPLNGFDLDPEGELQVDVDMNEDSEKEEEEVTLALTPERSFLNHSTSYSNLHRPIQDRSTLAGPSNAASTHMEYEAQPQNEEAPKEQPWTEEEDRILAAGDDEEAIKAIKEKRGKKAVKWRLVELSGDLDS